MRLFSEKLTKFYDWLDTVAASTLEAKSRAFCLFDAESLNWRYMRDVLFDRKEANQDFVSIYEEKDLAKRKPLVTLHKDIDATYSLHKSFAARHKTRMQIYRDDLANKGKRIKSAVKWSEMSVDKLREKIGGQA